MTKLKPSSRNSGSGSPQVGHLIPHAADAQADFLDVAPLDQHAGDQPVPGELVVAQPLPVMGGGTRPRALAAEV